MTTASTMFRPSLRVWCSSLPYRLRSTWQRAGMAWRFFTRRNTADEAHSMRYELHSVSGAWPLAQLDLPSFMETVQDRFGDDPRFQELARQACERTYQRWDDPGGELAGAASDAAMERFIAYANEDGIDLHDNWEV